MLHQLRGHELFDLIAKLNSGQIRALFECPPLYRPDGGGYDDVYQGAFIECLFPNLLQPIVGNHGRQLRAIVECPILDRLDGGGYVDAYEGPAVGKYTAPNLYQPIVENRSGQL